MGAAVASAAMSESSLVQDAITAIAPCKTGEAPAERSSADRFMRRLLRISDRPAQVTDDQVNRIFETSILISATRCLLAYVVFPIFAPALYAATSWGPAIGLVVGVVALFFDVVSIRRFWKADHRWRWPMTAIYACVITLVTVLLVSDITHLVA
jgi:hypothetical protein